MTDEPTRGNVLIPGLCRTCTIPLSSGYPVDDVERPDTWPECQDCPGDV